MKYGIYGVNRVSKDILYIFDAIEVVCFFDDSPQMFSFENRNVYDVNCAKSFLENKKIDQVMICDFCVDEKIHRLEQLGIGYITVSVFLENMFDINQNVLNPAKKPQIAWGVGKASEKLMMHHKLEDIEFFIDSNKTTETYKETDKKIYYPFEISNLHDYFIIITPKNYNEIAFQLEEKGLIKYRDYCTLSDLLPSSRELEMLKQTLFDKNCYDFECRSFFNHVEIGLNSLACCCVTFIPGSIGSMKNKLFDDVWKGIIHKIYCLSANNRTYSFCNANMCPLFIDRKNNASMDLNRSYLQIDEKPKNVAISIEETCNLRCVSCRDDVKIAKEKELEESLYFADRIIQEVIPYAEFVIMAGSGEVLLGKSFKKIYTNPKMKNVKYIRLLTNGTLFNEKNWKEISTGKRAKFILTVSIDAATKETYEMIRRNGNFDILKKNMEFAARLRKEGKLSYFRLNFVVQKKNYLEMPAFVEWGLELGVDEIFFTKILNWGTYSQEEFVDTISMMEEDGVTPQKELKEIIDLPIMKNKIVDLGTIRYSRKQIGSDRIDNYYRWELERTVPTLFS